MLYSAERRRGLVIVLVALCLMALLGIVAIALDGGLLLDDRRRLQSSADAAALAAAVDLYKNYPRNNGLDKGGTAKASALSIAALNGYNNDSTTNIVTVNNPAKSGNYAGRPGYAEVIIQYNQKRGFSAIWGSGTIPVTARAVARGQWLSLDYAIILLNPTGSGSLQANGNGTLNVSGGAVIVNSTDSAGGVTNGKNAVVTAPQLRFGGSPGYSGNFNPPNHDLSGNGSMNITGTFYAAAASLSVSGNGDSLGSQYVSRDLSIAGNGTVKLVYSNNSSARARLFGLVE